MLVWLAAVGVTQEAKPPPEIPKAVADLQGTFTGSWTSFGINAQGEVMKKSAWTDTIRVEIVSLQGFHKRQAK